VTARKLPPVPVTVVEAVEPVPVVWHEATVHLADVLDTLEAVREELVAIRQLLEGRP